VCMHVQTQMGRGSWMLTDVYGRSFLTEPSFVEACSSSSLSKSNMLTPVKQNEDNSGLVAIT